MSAFPSSSASSSSSSSAALSHDEQHKRVCKRTQWFQTDCHLALHRALRRARRRALPRALHRAPASLRGLLGIVAAAVTFPRTWRGAAAQLAPRMCSLWPVPLIMSSEATEGERKEARKEEGKKDGGEVGWKKERRMEEGNKQIGFVFFDLFDASETLTNGSLSLTRLLPQTKDE